VPTGKLLDILTYPDDRLTQECRPVESSEIESIQGLIDDMIYTMYYHGGVGLAAPQVGSNIRVFVIDRKPINGDQVSDPWVFINPEIVWESDDTVERREGCLSFPRVFCDIERPQWVKVKALDRNGEEFEMDASRSNLFSLALQHENDHLNGRLMRELAPKLDQKAIDKYFAR